MKGYFYKNLEDDSLKNKLITKKVCRAVLHSKSTDLFSLLQAAFNVRRKFWGKDVTIHIINNVQNGQCSENCYYCAQSRSSKASITTYPMKSDEEILQEAKKAYESGAFRYCMVFSGREQGRRRIERLTGIIGRIKKKYGMEVCVSPGFINEDEARILKRAGLDRLNHNINTSKRYYDAICQTHTFDKRLQTLNAAQRAGLDVCSGVIVGMGESFDDVIDAALTLRTFKNVRSIPVNFFLPITGTRIRNTAPLSPEYCLRVLCLYRFLNPKAEIRIAAGREYHLRDMQVLGLYPANSLFMDGYLNVKGAPRLRTLQMIKDAGFTVKSDQDIDDLIQREKRSMAKEQEAVFNLTIKETSDLRPSF